MRIAVVGSGPSAFYTVKYFLRSFKDTSVRIDMFERLPEPFGLVRFGVAPDHPEVKNVKNDFLDLMKNYSTRFSLHCGVHVPSSPEDFLKFRNDYDGVLIATGAQGSKLASLSTQSTHVSGRDFVLWYNGHPDKRNLPLPNIPPSRVSIFGMGNVALDVARMLSKRPEDLQPLLEYGLSPDALSWLTRRQESKTDQRVVEVQGRRGYLEASFTNKEFRELLNIPGCITVVDPAEVNIADLEIATRNDRAKSRGLEILQEMTKNFEKQDSQNILRLRFNCPPSPAELAISAIGFEVEPAFGLEICNGGLRHNGRGLAGEGLFLAGWAKRGPRGTIAANIPCAAETAKMMVEFYS